MTDTGTFRLTLPGQMLRRGFWLYVWKVAAADGRELLYVGRTGDNSSPNASPPYIRMGQHLGSMKNQNALRRHLTTCGIEPETCGSFELVAHGPIHPEVVKPEDFDHADKLMRDSLMELHTPFRNSVGAMEKQLEKELRSVGYVVMNEVKWKHSVNDAEWIPIRRAFATDFPKLKDLK
ncbi:hypothetical protein [Mesorhizobium sp. B2-3-15]|uniref:hypothetical protein n=1 Tax=Mesorhizobium sp. B2-3-15 TaxID=2589949 RepID=UPI00112A9B4A|nr:hypothetical protein [Mesorhizobium sp. B2-3-15]TPL75959.1 hypothetical protein FJ954_05950 [Mesorhizobium sp. B2-3-15]